MSVVCACSQAAAVAMLNALTPLFNGGSIKIFSGPMPANAELPDAGVMLSGGMTINATAFGSAVPNVTPRGAVATANPVLADNLAAASGTAAYWRAYDVNGVCLMQGNAVKAGVVGAMVLNTTTIIAGALVSCTAWTIILPDGS